MANETDANTVEGKCQLCKATFPNTSLKHASIPSVFALIAIGNSDLDDPDPIPSDQLTDKALYCPDCRTRVNMRRAISGLLILIAVLFLIAAFVDW